MSLPPIGAQGAPLTPPLPQPQDDTGLPPPPPRLEQTPNELLWMIAQAIQRQNRDTPPLDTVLELPRLNSRFAAVFGQPAAASRAMHALALAQTPGELVAAIDTLADLHPACAAPCWEAAWAGVDRFWPDHTDRLIWHLLDHLPAPCGLRQQQIDHALDFLLRRSCHSLQDASRQLLTLCAATGAISRERWRKLLQLKSRVSRFHRKPASPPDAAGITEDQQAQLRLMLDTREHARLGDPRAFLEMLERIEAIADPEIRLCLLERLQIHLAALGDDGPACAARWRQALLGLAGSPVHAQALKLLPRLADQRQRSHLLQSLAAFGPLQAARILKAHTDSFRCDADSLQQLCNACLALIERAQASPCEHRQVLLLLAGARFVGLPALARQLLAQCAELPPCHRVAVLVGVRRTARASPEFQRLWLAQWLPALGETTTALSQATEPEEIRNWLLALLPALPHTPLMVLPRLLGALPALDPEEQAQILVWAAPRVPDRLSSRLVLETDFQELLDHCAALPFYLRPAVLQAFSYLDSGERPSRARWHEIRDRTRAEARAWLQAHAADAASG